MHKIFITISFETNILKYITAISLIIILVTTFSGCQCINEATNYSDLQSEDIYNPKINQHNDNEPTTLTLATFNSYDNDFYGQDLRSLVLYFNSTNPDYIVEVIDYSIYNTADGDNTVGITRLLTKLQSNTPPDIIDVNGLPIQSLITRGFLADLYPFIDDDTEITRDVFTEGVLQVFERENHLYYLPKDFHIQTIAGHPQVLGFNQGWILDEFIDTISAHPNADYPLGGFVTKNTFLNILLSFNMDNYINFEEGIADFSSIEFISLLTLANTLPDETDNTIHGFEAISTGRQIMSEITLKGFSDIQLFKALYGGSIVYKGFPSYDRKGHNIIPGLALAITENSSNKDASWQFVRLIIDKDWQIGQPSSDWSFSTIKNIFNLKAEEALNTTYGLERSQQIGIPFKQLTEDDIDQIIEMLNSANAYTSRNDTLAIREIVNEEASNFFNGIISIEDTVSNIQNRISLYLNE